MKKYELKALHDSRNSFYGKATVIETEEKSSLYSYDTLVAEINLKNHKAEVFGTFSQTTLRHIKEFLWQNGYEIGTKKEIEKKYIKEVN